MGTFLLSLAAIFVGAFVLEYCVIPRRAEARPLFKAQIFGTLPLVGLFLILLMVSYRPVFSSIGTLIAFLAVVLLNNAKFHALKEPLVFSDFALFRHVIQHPQLYLKYIGIHNIAIIFLLGAVTIALGITLEQSMVPRTNVVDFLPAVIFLAVLATIVYALVAGRSSGRSAISFGAWGRPRTLPATSAS